MTNNQLNGIIRVIRRNYNLEKPHTTAKVLETLMVDIASELGFSSTFDCKSFLRRCGHPDYQPKSTKEKLS